MRRNSVRKRTILLLYILISALFISFFPDSSVKAQSLTRYPTSATTMASAPYDDNDWTSPTNVFADDGAYCSITAATFDAPDYSYILIVKGFGFNLPDGAIITGIMVEIERYNDPGETGQDALVQLTKDGTNGVGNNKAVPGNWPTTPTIATYGGSNDLWGTTWTEAEIESSNFGLRFAAQATTRNADIYVDFIRITVYYRLDYKSTFTESVKVTGTPEVSYLLKNWCYRKSHNLTGATGAGRDYQIRMIIHYGSGVDSGENVYLNGLCRPDFGDVRFSDEIGKNVYSYWFEEKVDGDYAVAWVKIPLDLTYDQKIYIYFGNPGCAYGGSLENTFISGSDFLSSTGWSIRYGSLTSWSVENGVLKIYGYNGYLGKDWSYPTGYGLRCIIKWMIEQHATMAVRIGYEGDTSAYLSMCMLYQDNLEQTPPSGSYKIESNTGSSSAAVLIKNIFLDANKWQYIHWAVTGSGNNYNYWFWENRTLLGSDSVNNYPPLVPIISYGVHVLGTGMIVVDHIAFGKYVYPEPGHGAWGNIEIIGLKPKESLQIISRRTYSPIAWLAGWSYRKAIFIKGTQGAGENYTIQLNVHYGNGIDNGKNIFLGEKCNYDFSDIRFTDNDGVTLLDYYIGRKNDGNVAVVWVKVKDSLDQDTNIYIYYGNSEATDASTSPRKFFLFYETFDGNELNSTIWKKYYTGTGNSEINVTDNVLTIYHLSGSRYVYAYTNNSYSTGVIYNFTANFNYFFFFHFGWDGYLVGAASNIPRNSYLLRFNIVPTVKKFELDKFVSGSFYNLTVYPYGTTVPTGWNNYSIICTNTNIMVYLNNLLIINYTATVSPGLFAYYAMIGNYVEKHDNLIIRKYVYPPPKIMGYDDEENYILFVIRRFVAETFSIITQMSKKFTLEIVSSEILNVIEKIVCLIPKSYLIQKFEILSSFSEISKKSMLKIYGYDSQELFEKMSRRLSVISSSDAFLNLGSEVLKNIGGIVFLTENNLISESIIKGLSRITADFLKEITEMTQLIGFSRKVSEENVISTSFSKFLKMFKENYATLTLDTSFGRKILSNVLISANIVSFEKLQERYGKIRSAFEEIKVISSLSSRLDLRRIYYESSIILSYHTFSRNIVLEYSAVWKISETSSRFISLHRNLQEIGDIISRLEKGYSSFRTALETNLISSFASRTISIGSSLHEEISSWERIIKSIQFTSIYSTISATDVMKRIFGIHNSVSESLFIPSSMLRKISINFFFPELLNLDEKLIKGFYNLIYTFELIDIRSLSYKIMGKSEWEVEGLTLIERFQKYYGRRISEFVTTFLSSDLVIRLDKVYSAKEIIGVFETAGKGLFGTAYVSELLQVYVKPENFQNFVRSFSNIILFEERMQVGRGFEISFLETITPFISILKGFSVNFMENLSVFLSNENLIEKFIRSFEEISLLVSEHVYSSAGVKEILVSLFQRIGIKSIHTFFPQSPGGGVAGSGGGGTSTFPTSTLIPTEIGEEDRRIGYGIIVVIILLMLLVFLSYYVERRHVRIVKPPERGVEEIKYSKKETKLQENNRKEKKLKEVNRNN
ncbi:MAG: DUF2341 domain-containing protein, partial [Candidatus Nanoarchaeia archaeon]|nr:DUF2341 domain-containing protein [Candidatus Jingweiarchaeum tengchongense]